MASGTCSRDGARGKRVSTTACACCAAVRGRGRLARDGHARDSMTVARRMFVCPEYRALCMRRSRRPLPRARTNPHPVYRVPLRRWVARHRGVPSAARAAGIQASVEAQHQLYRDECATSDRAAAQARPARKSYGGPDPAQRLPGGRNANRNVIADVEPLRFSNRARHQSPPSRGPAPRHGQRQQIYAAYPPSASCAMRTRWPDTSAA